MSEPLSVVVTTLNNAATLGVCLDSVRDIANDIVVLDSGSTDETAHIAGKANARFFLQPFRGYGPQKAAAIALAKHDWVLLLDADEALTDESRAAVLAALESPQVSGFTLPRREQLFWTWAHRNARHNPMLRLFDRRVARFTPSRVHAAPQVEGRVESIDAPFLHYGEPDIATKVAKINHYSTGAVDDKAGTHRFAALRMVTQPPLHFFKNYVLKRRFLAGWAGFIGCWIDAFYVFLKYAKLLESRNRPEKPDA